MQPASRFSAAGPKPRTHLHRNLLVVIRLGPGKGLPRHGLEPRVARLHTKKMSGDILRVGIFLGFVRLTTRAEGPPGAHVQGAKRNGIDPH